MNDDINVLRLFVDTECKVFMQFIAKASSCLMSSSVKLRDERFPVWCMTLNLKGTPMRRANFSILKPISFMTF